MITAIRIKMARATCWNGANSPILFTAHHRIENITPKIRRVTTRMMSASGMGFAYRVISSERRWLSARTASSSSFVGVRAPGRWNSLSLVTASTAEGTP